MRICDRCEGKFAMEVVTAIGQAKYTMDLCTACEKHWKETAFNLARYIFLHDRSSTVYREEIKRLGEVATAKAASERTVSE